MLVLLYLRAFYQQNFWKLPELIKNLSDIEEYFVEKIFIENLDDIFGCPHPIFPDCRVYYGEKVTHLINYALIAGENFMQHTAVLSQLKKNTQSLTKVMSCY